MTAAVVSIFLACAIGMLAVGERRRRLLAATLSLSERAAERLRDEVWRLEAAAEARDRAEAANEAKSRFLATVSHEIRTPLNGILGMADLLSALDLGGEAESYVSAIRTSGTALATLIDEILDFSRIEAGRLELDDIEFDLAALIEGVVELLAPRAQGKGLEIASLLSPDVPVRMRGDPARLRQILINLAGNAIKFTDNGGVGLRASLAPGGQFSIAVEDTGCGISPDRQAAVFDEFEQEDGSTTRRHGGTGLGLAISRALAGRMGGELTLAHSGPAGSVFTLTLPIARPQGPSAIPEPTANLRDLRVLVVAQSPFEAPFLGERLAAAGAQVQRADGADAALIWLQKDIAPDVVIVDCAIGESAAESIASAAHGAGVGRTLVLVSPFERRNLAPLIWSAFDGWLVKPVRAGSLLSQLAGGGHVSSDAARETDRARDDMAAAPRLDGLRVLVAEDNDINALIAMRHLERQGAFAMRVGDGAAAVAAVESSGTAQIPEFDAVFLDIRMPRLDGLAAARLIRDFEAANGRARVPLIALTANAFDEDRTAAELAGFDTFLVKPVSLSQLARAVAGAAFQSQPSENRA